jgi:hypothetical protein
LDAEEANSRHDHERDQKENGERDQHGCITHDENVRPSPDTFSGNRMINLVMIAPSCRVARRVREPAHQLLDARLVIVTRSCGRVVRHGPEPQE